MERMFRFRTKTSLTLLHCSSVNSSERLFTIFSMTSFSAELSASFRIRAFREGNSSISSTDSASWRMPSSVPFGITWLRSHVLRTGTLISENCAGIRLCALLKSWVSAGTSLFLTNPKYGLSLEVWCFILTSTLTCPYAGISVSSLTYTVRIRLDASSLWSSSHSPSS